MKTRLLNLLCALAVSALAPVSALAQAYPSKPIKILVPYPPGGASDITTRIFAAGVSDILGQQVIIENKPGAGTNIGAEAGARAAPDGYTLYVANFASHAVNRHLFSKLPFHPVNDFTQIAMMTKTVLFLCGKPGSPFSSAADIVAFGKANPGKLTYGSPGNGSPNHIAGEQLKQRGNFEAVHVPYKGAAELNADLLAGQIDYAFDASVIAHHRSGKLKCFGVTSTERWPTDLEIPTVADTGVPGFELTSFFGIVGPARMPADIVQKINDAFVAVGKKPETAEKIKVTSGVLFPASVRETEAFLTEQDQKWADVVRKSGAKVD